MTATPWGVVCRHTGSGPAGPGAGHARPGSRRPGPGRSVGAGRAVATGKCIARAARQGRGGALPRPFPEPGAGAGAVPSDRRQALGRGQALPWQGLGCDPGQAGGGR